MNDNFWVSCPDWPQAGIDAADDIIGCGHAFYAGPEADEDGMIDCPVCGICFTREQGTQLRNG